MKNIYASLQLSEELDTRARVYAATNRISRSKLFRMALERFLEEEGNDNKTSDRKTTQAEERKSN